MADPARPEAIDAPVTRVVLFEDRVTVCRRIELPEAGRRRIRVGPLTPLVRERSLAVVGDGILVEDVAVERERVRVAEADSAVAAELSEGLEALEHRSRRHAAALQRATEHLARTRSARDAARATLPRALVERDDQGAWLAGLRTLEEAAVDAEVRAAQAHRRAEQLTAEVEALRARLAEARAGTSVLRAHVVLQVLVEAPGTLRLEYTVPCGVWRPVHRATLTDERVGWEVAAMAWNGTGEDWRGVQLVCSTARPHDHASPPELSDDVISTRRRDREVVVEARDEQIAEARVGERQARSEVGVDDGGEPRTFTAPAPVDLPSDGRPVRVLLETWETGASRTWVGHPERSGQVVLRSTQPNAGTRPLLAGPVELIRDGIAVGTAEIGLVAPGEPFHLGWGSHDGLRVVRRRDHEVDRGRITGRQTHRFEITLRVTHLGDEPVTCVIVERIPVSELKEVGVQRPTAVPALTEGPDADGFCTWRVTLQPGAVEQLVLRYTVEAPSNVRLPF